MNEIAKSKRGRKQNWNDEAIRWETGTGEFDLAATIEERQILREEAGEEPTQYEAPKERKWKARNVVTIHWQLTGIECPYPSMQAIFACVIDHSNINTGQCDASQRLIALETGYNPKTVRKVLRWVEEKTKFLVIEERGRRRGGKFKSLAYHVQWQALEIFWIGISDNIEATKEAWRNSDGDVTAKSPWELKGGHGEGNSRVDMDHGNSRVASNHESLNHEVGNTSLRVHLPSAKDTHVSEGQLKEEKGIQGRGEVESLSTNSQPPAKPTPTVYELVDMQAEKREAAAAAVDADLLALPVYVALLGWPELESHLGEAAAAELNARGSGAKLILARFAERTGS